MNFMVGVLVLTIVFVVFLKVMQPAAAQPRVNNPSDCNQLEAAVDYLLTVDRMLQSDALTLKAAGVIELKSQICKQMAAVKTAEDFRALLDKNHKEIGAHYEELSVLFESNGNLERLRALPKTGGNLANQLELFMSAEDAKRGYEIMDRETKIGARQRVLGWVFLQVTGMPYAPPD